MGSGRCAKSLKGSLRVSRFFEGAREELRETIVIGRCNFRVSREEVAVVFTRLRRGGSQVQWIEFWRGDAGIVEGIFWGICALWERETVISGQSVVRDQIQGRWDFRFGMPTSHYRSVLWSTLTI
jgi:hypothetical protein